MRLILLMSFILVNVHFSFTMAADAKYHFSKEIPVAGDLGWDYVSIDSPSRRLYLSHGDHIVVIDLDSDKIIGSIADTPGVHGFAAAPELGRGFSSNGKESKMSIVDLKTLKTISKISTGENPDTIIYDPGHKEVYTFNGKSKSATVIEAATGKVVTTIPLDGTPEFAAVDPNAHRMYVNIEDKNSISVIDTESHKVIAHWGISPGEEASGLSIDLTGHRLIVGCHNKMMLLIDSTNGHVIDHTPIGKGVDANWYDSETHLAFSSNGDGTVNIAQVSDKFKPVQTLTTHPRSRTMALDQKSHRLYLPSADFLPAKDAHSRGSQVPGTFKILVYEMNP